MAIEISQAARLFHMDHGVLRLVGFKGLRLFCDQLGQSLRQNDKLLNPFGDFRRRRTHGFNPCIFSISRWTVAAIPMPPLSVIFLAIASVRNDLNMLSPGPPPKG